MHCPGCYAYGSNHLGGEVTLRELSDKRGDELVEGVLDLVNRHKPLHVTLVGGEPMVRHRELSRILPELATRGIYTMVVTSGIIPVPMEWMKLPHFTLAVSIDGLPEHHNERRAPATYDRILENIAGRRTNIHWTITAPMLERASYLEEYVRFWNERGEVQHIWVSLYTPQRGETSPEMLSQAQREFVARELPRLRGKYRKLLTPEGYASGAAASTSVAGGLHVFAFVEELLGGFADACGAVRIWRRSRLLAVRLLSERGGTLGERDAGCGAAEGEASAAWIDATLARVWRN